MAKHVVEFNGKGIVATNSLNWEIYYDGVTAFFMHNKKCRLSFVPQKGIKYLFNAEKGNEWVKPFMGPNDPKMNAFWERGFFKGYWDPRLKEVDAGGRVYERMFLSDIPEALLNYIDVSSMTWLGYKVMPCPWWEKVYGINCNGYYKTVIDIKGRTLISAYMNYECGHTKAGFWFAPEVTVEQIENFLKDYPWGK